MMCMCVCVCACIYMYVDHGVGLFSGCDDFLEEKRFLYRICMMCMCVCVYAHVFICVKIMALDFSAAVMIS